MQINLDTLYTLEDGSGSNQAIEVIGGTVDIYGSFKTPSSAPVEMDLTKSGFVGIDKFDVMPKYLYITQDTGTTTHIGLVGLKAEAV